jgi:hypothetical protein
MREAPSAKPAPPCDARPRLRHGRPDRHTAVDLFLHIERDADNRLTGAVRAAGASEAMAFSGTLELMRVFEELVPAAATATARARPNSLTTTPTDCHPATEK